MFDECKICHSISEIYHLGVVRGAGGGGKGGGFGGEEPIKSGTN